MTLRPPAPAGPAKRLTMLVLFAAAMGWLEGVVVVYIRGLLGVARPGPLPSGGEVMRQFAKVPWLMGTEQTRELATLVMLIAVAWLAGDRGRSRFGAFLVAFGVWDIVYYLALFAMLRWPSSLASIDVLFLIPPHPWWSQPVWVPIAIASAMVAFGARMFLSRRPAL
jgi:hypothetical protein